MPRIFIAAVLPDAIKKDISHIIKKAGENFSGIRWEKPGKIHVTLKFIGSINDKTRDDILGIVKKIAVKTRTIKVSFSHIDAFPDFRKPRVLVLRLNKSQQLQDLYSIIEDELADLGIKKEERNFIPHITIGRIGKGFKVRDKGIKIESKEFNIMNIAVIKSELKKDGSNYINLGVYKLS